MLLLPLLGGYIFVRFWNHTRIHILRADKDRLLIRASISGLINLIIAYALSIFGAWLFPCSEYSICISRWWGQKVPFEYSGVSFAALAIGATAWKPLNYFYTRDKEIDRAIQEDANPLELMLKRAQDNGIEVLITMTNHKVYVGFITHQLEPATPTNFIGIFPVRSGYRDATTKQLFLPINYSQVYSKITEDLDSIDTKINNNQKLLDDETILVENKSMIEAEIIGFINEWHKLENITNQFEVVIPVNQIVSINFYDKAVHTKYFLAKSTEIQIIRDVGD
ncbi:MAG: hypothetical protein JWP66_2078 [Naasia sp.]|nr:hypothetical protein [Naasia sp.]